jgi:LPXTG-site transpeptidase (sortase) family protein
MDRILRVQPKFAERATWTVGLIGLAVWGTFHFGMQRSALRPGTIRGAGSRDRDAGFLSLVDTACVRVAESGEEPFPDPRGSQIRNSVSSRGAAGHRRALDRGLGHIRHPALPGADGNSGIAGHRDGFFRGLKDIQPGDTIEVDTLDRKDIYRVERTWIVDPSDVSVLDPTAAPSLTLVTCYPFYFVGSAPQRFIVRAVRVGSHMQRKMETVL